MIESLTTRALLQYFLVLLVALLFAGSNFLLEPVNANKSIGLWAYVQITREVMSNKLWGSLKGQNCY